MKPAEFLSDELDQIFCMIDILEVMVGRLEQGKSVNLDDIKKLVHFFRVFTNQTHNKKEEEILFPEIKKDNINNQQILDTMKSENSLAELYLNSLNNIIDDVKNGDGQAKNKMITLIKKYLILEKNHLQKEQIFVLPLCNQEIPKEKQKKK